MQKPSVDYRNFRLGKLNTDEFRHILLLLFWPAFGLLFDYVERYYPVEKYYSVHCALDDAIPFCEWFFIPYLFWFVWLVGTIAYTFFYDIPAFKKMMYFIIFTYTATIIIYFLFPTCQDLRPPEFERQNLLTQMISGFYQFDTNTNVCPSIHVIGSFAGAFALWNCRALQKPQYKVVSAVIAVLISISTVFVKQHSVIDVIAALPLCAIGYYLCFSKKRAHERSSEAVLD